AILATDWSRSEMESAVTAGGDPVPRPRPPAFPPCLPRLIPRACARAETVGSHEGAPAVFRFAFAQIMQTGAPSRVIFKVFGAVIPAPATFICSFKSATSLTGPL